MQELDENWVLVEQDCVSELPQARVIELINNYLNLTPKLSYKEKLDKLGKIINLSSVSKIHTLITIIAMDKSLIAIKDLLAEPVNMVAAKKYYNNAITRPLTEIPKDVWHKHILSQLDDRDLASFAKSCSLFREKASLDLRYGKLALVFLVKNHKLEEVCRVLTRVNLDCYRWCIREKSPFYIAALDRNKLMFDLLVNRLPPENRESYELAYLVISNQGEMQGKEWKFDAETYVRERVRSNPDLIFKSGPEGLSPLQIAAADKDIHMLLALLNPLTKNTGKLEETPVLHNGNIDSPRNLASRIEALVKDLPIEVLSAIFNQLDLVLKKGWIIDVTQRYFDLYNIFRNQPIEENWRAIGKQQRMMPLHARADLFFPDGVSDYFYGDRCGSRAFSFEKASLFTPWAITQLGTSFSLVRGCWLWWQTFSQAFLNGDADGLIDNANLDCENIISLFEARTQQLDFIVNTIKIQLFQQEIDNVEPVICQSLRSS